MNTLIKEIEKNGLHVAFISNTELNIMCGYWIRTLANVKKGEGRKVLIKKTNDENWTTCGSQKEALNWLNNNINSL